MTELKRIQGRSGWWIVDCRDGKTLTISAGEDSIEAQAFLHRYVTRRELEKHGYEDRYQELLDKLWGKKNIESQP